MFLLYLLSWIGPTTVIGPCRVGYLGLGFLWCSIAICRYREVPRLCAAVCFALVIQLWSIFVSIYAYLNVARQVNAGRPDYYIMESLLPFFLASALVRLDPNVWRTMFRWIGIAFGVSCCIGFLQFFRIPPAMSLAHFYQEKSIDFWDGVPGVRALGLSWHPNGLAFQALVLLAMVGGRSVQERPSRREFATMVFLSVVVVMTQARISFFVLAIVWIFIGAAIFRQDRKLFVRLLGVGALGIALAFAFGGRRLGYTFQSSSTKSDAGYQYRANSVWAQLDPIYPRFALTGIGPSSGLMLGTGPEDKWVSRGVILESAYRLYIAMYGLPGLGLYIVALLSALFGSMRVALNRTLEEAARRCACVSVVTVIYLIVNSFTLNTVDNYTLLSLSFLVGGLTAANTYASNPLASIRPHWRTKIL